MNPIQEKITKAKVNLILNHLFYATLVLNMKFIEDSTIETACTNGIDLRYNPKFIETLTQDKTVGLLAHEVMHPAMMHHTRIGNRDLERWNKAADYAINQILIDSKFDLPEQGLINPAFKNMSAEEIYNLLPPSTNDPDKKPNPDPGKNGGVNKAPGQTQTEIQKTESEVKQLLAEAAQVAKMQGKLPAHLERLIDSIIEPVVNWHSILNAFLTEISRNDYSFSKPSSRYISQGLYLPSLHSIEKGSFALLVDTSGSIDQKLLNEFAGEIQGILSESAKMLSVIFVDAEINNVQEFEPDEEINLMPEGGGGTDFKPGFEYIEENQIDPACVVYFTDGYCSSFPHNPDYPVLWAVYGGHKDFAPPFGEVIHIK